MKLLFSIIAGFIFFQSSAQNTQYHVVFDLTSQDTMTHKSVIRWLKGISSSNPDAKLEVVMYGQSLSMVTAEKSIVSSDITELLKNKNVSFKVCEAAMRRHMLTKEQFIAGVETVPDGIYEIISKQKEGWGYIKVGN